MKIGIFDSGLGGLTIVKAIIKKLPQYDYLYLGDNARVPYGGRSAEIIYQFTKQAVDFLFKKNCKLIILACNSATANALKRLQHEYLPKKYPDRKILGIIKPTIEYLNESRSQKVAVIGTHATVESQAYPREIHKVVPSARIWQQACPLLVPVIEENEIKWPGTTLLLKKYLRFVKRHQAQVLLLACTHYGIIKNQIKKQVGKDVRIVEQGKLVAEKLADYLKKHLEITQDLNQEAKRTYYVTDLNERFGRIARIFIQERITIQKITL